MSVFSTLGTFLFSLISGDQFQSLLRTVLKIAGTALVVKAKGDPGSVDAIVGGVIALVGLLGSFVTHGSADPAPAASA